MAIFPALRDRKRRTFLKAGAVCLLLSLLVGAAFGPLLGHGFILFDDELYLTKNDRVRGGLSADGIAWAFRSVGYASNWHPLTWLSHMLDVSLFGISPGGHHLTSLLLHLANTILLFLVFRRLTGACRRSALVAGLFALHPLHVESVAWISERKDVLSTFFWLLSLAAWVRYLRRPAVGRYLPALILFALGLLAKPMVLTLPLVLLLLDLWPLGRAAWPRPPGTPSAVASPARLALEKFPFLALSAASGVVTYIAQQRSGSLGSFGPRGGWLPLANAAVSYVAYLQKTVWPSGLAIFYPYPVHSLPFWKVGLCAVFMAAATLLAILTRRWHPWLLSGWLWYLGTLVPVIGLVQVGGQAMADRYTYIPLAGVFIALVWGSADLLPQSRRGIVAAAIAIPLLGALTLLTRVQVGYWRDDVTLGQHALEVTSGNWLVENNLGLALARQGRFAEALSHYREAVRIMPNLGRAWVNLGAALEDLGRAEEAIAAYREGIRGEPGYAEGYYNLALMLTSRGLLAEAVAAYRTAVRLDPANADAWTNLGLLLLRTDSPANAATCLEQGLALNPADDIAHEGLGLLAEHQGRGAEAERHYRAALAIRPDRASVREGLNRILRTQSGIKPVDR